MTKSMVLGLLVAMLLFWAVGAYNRLVRLRAEVSKAFSALDNVLSVQPALIKTALPDELPAEAVSVVQTQLPPATPWARLAAAGEQVALALANVRARPLDPQAVEALSAARGVLADVRQSAGIAQYHDAPSEDALPDALLARLAALDEQAVVPAAAFDAAVQVHNLAIRQFPALILARIWGFKPAAALRWPTARA